MNLWYNTHRFFKSLPYIFHRTKIRVVHDDDLLSLITSLGINNDIQQQKYHCICCNSIITIENLWGFFVREGSIHLICSNPECLSEIY